MKKMRRRKSHRPAKELADRVNVSINPEILRRADRVMSLRALSKFSHLVATLIREEYDRRVEFHPFVPPPPTAQPMNYSSVDGRASDGQRQEAPQSTPHSTSEMEAEIADVKKLEQEAWDRQHRSKRKKP